MSATETPRRIETTLANSANPIQAAAINQILSAMSGASIPSVISSAIDFRGHKNAPGRDRGGRVQEPSARGGAVRAFVRRPERVPSLAPTITKGPAGSQCTLVLSHPRGSASGIARYNHSQAMRLAPPCGRNAGSVPADGFYRDNMRLEPLSPGVHRFPGRTRRARAMKRWMGSLGRATEIEADGQRPRVPIAVQIEANAGYATEYWPAREGPLRLRAVHPPAADSLPGDLGHVLDARTQDGDLLRAIVLGRASAHPGAVVPGHILGFVRPADAEEGWLLVVPEADRWLAMTGDVHDLPSDLQQRLLMFLQAERLEWIGAEEADIEARQAVLRGRRVLAQERAERAAAEAAWAPTEAARRRWATFEGEAHTAAELDILRLPYRFQLYAREVILPHERLLATVHRPGLSISQWPFSRRTEHEALLLLTTRQLLLLSDARPPDTMVRFGGFAARATGSSVCRVPAWRPMTITRRSRLGCALRRASRHGPLSRRRAAMPQNWLRLSVFSLLARTKHFRPSVDTLKPRTQIRRAG